MRAAISTDLLLRLMNATAEQYAAVAKILGAKCEPTLNFQHSTSNVEVEDEGAEPVSGDVAKAAFALLVKLDAQGKQKAPTPMTVFRLYCIAGLSAEQVATKCRCSKATVMGRLRVAVR